MSRFIFSLLWFQLRMVVSVWKAYWFLVYVIFVAFVIYVAFFTLYLPPAEHIKPIHFQYNYDCERLSTDPLCTFPTASVVLYDYYKSGKEGVRVLARGQEYIITTQLEMPLSEENRKLGDSSSCEKICFNDQKITTHSIMERMFLSKIDLLSKEGKVLDSSSRSSLFAYQSSLLSTLSTLFFIIPLLFGFQEERKWIDVVLLDSYIDSSYEPAVCANITIFSKQIQFYSARLKITAVFSGIRYYMHFWPITFSVFAFTNILAVVTFVFLWRKMNTGEARTRLDNLSDDEDDDANSQRFSEQESEFVEEVDFFESSAEVNAQNSEQNKSRDIQQQTSI